MIRACAVLGLTVAGVVASSVAMAGDESAFVPFEGNT